MSLYDNLGLGKDASPEEIKEAFRNAAKNNHPDRGGDPEKFNLVKYAYDILKDPKKRLHYDNTGEEQRITPFHVRFGAFVQQYLVRVILMTKSVEEQDLKKGFVSIAEQCIVQCTNKLQELKKDSKEIVKIENVIKRLTKKSPGQDILCDILRAEVDVRRRKNNLEVEQFEEEMKFLKECREVLQSYEYKFEKPDIEKQANDLLSSLMKGSSHSITFTTDGDELQ